MGLAASQAKFLAITSRKANCEYRTTELAQQRLSYTRELDNISKEYQDALNSTMLVWDADGSGDYRYQLSYDIMMSPSDYNQYTPYLVSRQDGKIAFDDNMMKAIAQVFNYDEGTGTTDGGVYIIDSNGEYLKDDNGNYIVIYKGETYVDSSSHTEYSYDTAKTTAFAYFIEALKDNKAIQGSVADKIKNEDGKYVYIDDAGVGGELYAKTKANAMTANGLCSYVDYIVDNVLSGYYSYDTEEYQLAETLIFDFEKHKYLLSSKEKQEKGYTQKLGEEIYNLEGTISDRWKSTNGTTCLLINGSYANDSDYTLGEQNNAGGYNNAQYSASAFTLADLLSEDVTLMVTGQQNYNGLLNVLREMRGSESLVKYNVDQWYDECVKAMNNSELTTYSSYRDLYDCAKKFYEGDYSDKNQYASSTLALLNFFDGLAKSMWNLLMPKDNPSNEETNAFYIALENTIVRLQNTKGSSSARNYDSDYVETSSSNRDSESQAKSAVNDADNYNCWVKCGNEWAISLSNLAEGFLTDFVNGMDNYQNGCLISQNAKTSTYITDFPNYQYTVNVTNESNTGLWESEFYSVIFNNICQSGAYANENVKDNEYLENALKNGQLFVMSKADDNRYYQSRYTDVSGGHFVVEKDNAAIERAEREYLYKKNKINYKEEQIELEMKQLDAEISELTTELESVKNLIKTSIEKTLKMFQS